MLYLKGDDGFGSSNTLEFISNFSSFFNRHCLQSSTGRRKVGRPVTDTNKVLRHDATIRSRYQKSRRLEHNVTGR